MPRGDRTGPMGEGPMTGLRRGQCADDGVGLRRGIGFGRGRGFGLGRGLSWRWSNENPADTDESTIKSTIGVLKEQLTNLEKRLQNLKSKD